MHQSEQLVVTVLRQERAEQQARLAEIEGTVAWQAGGLLLAMMHSPLRRGPGGIFRLMRLFLGARRGRSRSVGKEIRRPSPLGMKADYVVYGNPDTEIVLPGPTWQTEDAGELLDCLERRESPGVLVLRRVDGAVVRPLARFQVHGWRLVWYRPEGNDGPEHLVRYVSGIADEIIDGQGQ